ncbi:MAG: phage tail tip lysozyme [Pseudomonadota bacterium]
MPIIVPIEENKVGLATATDAKFRAPDYSGSGLEALGAGLVKLGDGGRQLASGIEERRRRAAEAIAAAMLDDDHQRYIDDAAVKKAYVAYSDLAHEALHGDEGLFNQQGADAHAAFPGLVEKLVDNHDKSLSKLDGVQRAAITPAMNKRLRNDVERAAEHVRQQGVAEQKWQSEELQKAAARDAVNHVDDRALFDHHLATGENAIRQQGRIDRLSDKEIAKKIADLRSGTIVDGVAALAVTDPAGAADFLTQYGGDLSQQDKRLVASLLATQLQLNTSENEDKIDAGDPVVPDTGAGYGSLDNDAATFLDRNAAAAAEDGAGAAREPDADPYSGLRALMKGFPGGGTLEDAASSPAKPGPRARPDLAARWNSLSEVQRLQDSELRNAMRAANAAKTLLASNDPDLLENLGMRNQVMGDDVKAVIMRYLNEMIIPRALERGVIFSPYSDQDLQAGGPKAGLLYGALREANARALNHRQRQALDFFLAKGWSPEQASGIVASLTAESGLDSQRRQEKNRKGYGLAQWSLGEDRAINFLKVKGVPLQRSSFQQQLEFINYELTQGPRLFVDVGNRLKLANTAGDAATIFASDYERMGNKAQPAARAKIAESIFKYFFQPK